MMSATARPTACHPFMSHSTSLTPTIHRHAEFRYYSPPRPATPVRFLITAMLIIGGLTDRIPCGRCAATTSAAAASSAQASVPVRAVTQGPRYHWFGYYDKLQFDPTSRYLLAMEVDFEHRSPRPDDVIRVGMIDLQDGDRWIELGTSRAWSWQQGCMLQWRPGSRSEVLWNDRQGDRFVCHILNVRTHRKRTIPWPIYAVSPDGKTAVAPDFRRIQDTRPGYGYAGLPDPYADQAAPAESGIRRVDLETGTAELIITLARTAALANPPDTPAIINANAKHWFNHLLFNPDGTRFIFLHRWRSADHGVYRSVGRYSTRMLTAATDGSDIRVVDPYGKTSHFIWRDATHILAWAWHPSAGNKFYLYEDGTGRVEPVGLNVMTRNGHCSYLPGGDWILNDTYPTGPRREQIVYLYHVPSNRRIELGRFPSPPAYTGEWRVDTHPRFSPDGRWVCIDSAHGGNGRQLYLLDISEIVGR